MAARRALPVLGWVALAPVAGLPALGLVWIAAATGGLTGWRFAGAWSLAAVGVGLVAGSWLTVNALVRRRPGLAAGALLLLLSATWPMLAAVDPIPDAAVPLLAALGLLTPAGLALVAGGDDVATRAVGVLVGVALMAHALAYQPSLDPACQLNCVGPQPLLPGLTQEAVQVSSFAAAVAALVVLVRGPGRGRPRTIGVALTVAAAVAMALYVARAAAWGPSVMDGPRLLLPLVPLVIVAGSMEWERLRTDRSRRLVRRLLDELVDDGAGTSTGSWQFALPDRDGAWVDPWGNPVAEDPPGVDLEIRRPSGEVVARRTSRVEGRASRRRTPPVRVEQAADRILVENARSAALLRADARELLASQRRIVEAADAEARRIERDLHDGAQQTLVGASFHVNIALRASHDDPDQAQLADVRADLRLALDGLREVAHGTLPRLLVSDGTGAALREAREGRGILRLVEDTWGSQAPTSVAVAAYRLVLVAAGAASGPVFVRLLGEPGDTLTVMVDGSGFDWETDDVQRVNDRIEALGGSLERRQHPGGEMVTAVFPCGS